MWRVLNWLSTAGVKGFKLTDNSRWQKIQGLGLWCLMPLSTIFQIYRGSQFYWWRKPEFRRKPSTCCMSLTTFITMLYQAYLAWAGLELTTLVVIGTDCICNCKSNYHTITTTMAPDRKFKVTVRVSMAVYRNNLWVFFSQLRTIQWSILPSLVPIGPVISEKKI